MAENREATDVQIAAGLTTAGLLSDEGLGAMEQVVGGASNPAAAIGNAVFMALSKVREKLDQQGIPIDDKLWIANGGVLDRVLFEVCATLKAVLGFEPAGEQGFSGEVKSTVIQLMEDEDNGQSPEQGAPTMEQMPAEEVPMQQAPQGNGLLGAM